MIITTLSGAAAGQVLTMMLPPIEIDPGISWNGESAGRGFSGAPTRINLPSGRSKDK
jgi:hypothetical protein